MPSKIMIAVATLGAGALVAPWSFAADSDAGLQEIVVTAQKREESAQNVAISMSVISGGDLAAKNITYVNDLANATPSLQVEPAFGSSQAQFRLRGVGFIDYTSNNTSPVGVNVDGVALALPIQTQGQLFDIDRVEVLRGPQGTLYGRNSTGGTINFITNRPTEETHFGGQAEWGSHNLFTAEAFASGTLLPTLTGRLSVATEQGGAWQRDRTTGDALGDKDKVSLRGQLEWKPGEVFDAHLGLHWARDKSDEQGLYLLREYPVGSAPPTLPADTSPYITGWHLNPAYAAIIGLPDDAKPGLNNSNYGADLTANGNFGFARLTSITSWSRQIRREYGDWDATAFDDSDEYLDSGLKVFSQELRLASASTGKFDWVVGAIYANEQLNEAFYSDVLHSPAGGIIGLTTYGQTVKSIGVFGQAGYQFTDQWKISLGVREDHENRELHGLNTSFLAGALGVVPSLSGGPQSRVAVSNLPSGKIELDYKPLSDTLLYASVSRGVKSGGFTAHNTFTAASVDPFNPERLTSYEVGVKSDITKSLRVNASTYLYRYRDQQILSKVADVGGYVGRFANANARIAGAELEVDWLPVRNFTLTQYAGYVVGYYEGTLYDFVPTPASPVVGTNYDGRPEGIPKWSYGGDASYGISVGDYKITPEINWSMHDTYSQFFLLLGSNDFTIPRYWLANANISLTPAAGGPWSVSLWGRNVFDRRYDITRNFFLTTDYVAAAGEPATWGIRFSYKY